jgi:hypothetical protein
MTGFGIYETLRLVIPGSIAVAIFSAVLRLAAGEGKLLADGPFAGVVAALEGTTFLFAALAVGFILYLADLPTRARVFKGDPDNGIQLPTDALREMLKGTPHQDKSFSLYFILSDGRLPPELHRRIYFFGGLYRIYFDARLLAAGGVALGGPFALAVAGEGISDLIGSTYLASAAALLVVVVLMTLVGESRHAVESMKKHAPKDRPYPSSGLGREYLGRAWKGFAAMLPAAAVVLLLGIAANFMADAASNWLRISGVCTAGAALLLWVMVELGPPTPDTKDEGTRSGDPVRGRILVWLRLKPSTQTQYTQLQRGVMDLALFAPAVVGAACAAQNQGRSALWVLAWGFLLLPAVLIMAIRKHEQRLLASYKDQVRWLQINEENIKTLATQGPAGEWY